MWKKRVPVYPNSWARIFWKELKPSIQFHILHSKRSYSYLKVIRGWSYTCFRVFEHYSNLEDLLPVSISIVLPIFIFSTFRAFNYYSNNEVNELLWQVILEILGNNQLKSYFGNSQIAILSPFLQISLRRKLTLQNHVLNFKMHISRKSLILEQQMSSFDLSLIRSFIHGYCEVFNMA